MAFKKYEKVTSYDHTEGGYRDNFEVGGEANVKSLKVDGNPLSGDDVLAVTLAVRPYAIPLNEFRKPAAWKDVLDDAAGAGLFGLADTPGSLMVGQNSNAASVTNAAVYVFRLPAEYKAGGTITVRVRAKKDTTLATVGDTIDVAVKLVGDTLGSDLVTTAPQTPMTTSFAHYDFVVTPTGLVPGDLLAVEVKGISDDTGGATNQDIQVARVEMRIQAN
jgi:hypothetical protein